MQNLLKLKNKLEIKLGSSFCKATKFMEKRIFKLVSVKKFMVIGLSSIVKILVFDIPFLIFYSQLFSQPVEAHQ